MLVVLDKISTFLSNVLLWLGGVMLVAMMLLASANMLLRGIWVPIKGTYELIGFFGALVTAFGLGATQLKKGHIALTIMAGMFPKPVERAIDLFTNAICAIFFALVAWRTSVWAWSLVETGELSETLRFAYYPLVFAVAFGCAVIGLVLVCDFLKVLNGRRA